METISDVLLQTSSPALEYLLLDTGNIQLACELLKRSTKEVSGRQGDLRRGDIAAVRVSALTYVQSRMSSWQILLSIAEQKPLATSTTDFICMRESPPLHIGTQQLSYVGLEVLRLSCAAVYLYLIGKVKPSSKLDIWWLRVCCG